ncbi:MAG: chromate transporter, partial [Anaerolineae bacterium]|nr:chromate transporter [Anaerolineae bacterium]
VMLAQMAQQRGIGWSAFVFLGAAEADQGRLRPYAAFSVDIVARFGAASAASPPIASVSLYMLFWVFFKIGALLYGTGYVLFALFQAEIVERHGWLTEQQLIDAIAFGQMTPGPLSTSTTFIGYLLAGVPGALLGTAAFYLPAFVIVGLSHPLIPRIRNSAWASGLLDGVNVAALGLMAAVTWNLAHAAFVDAYTLLLGGIALGLLLRYKLNSAYLVLLGAGAGLLGALL